MKEVIFVGNSRAEVAEFPKAARQEAGRQLFLVQLGADPHDWKQMPIIGTGVKEIRVHLGGEFRVIYVAKLKTAIYVLHAFQKKHQKTSQGAIELARKRFKQIEQE